MSEPVAAPPPAAQRWRASGALLVGLACLVLLHSALTDVYSELGEVAHLDWRWLVAIVIAESATFVATWQLNRLALRTKRWFDVAVAQLVGNAATNVVPAGGPAGAAVQLRMLRAAGFDLTTAATSLGALSILGAAGLLSLPAVALPFAVFDRHQHGLQPALWLGVGLLLAVLLVGAVFLRRDGPLGRIAGIVQWLQRHLWPRRPHRGDLVARVLRERDNIRAELREHPYMVVFTTISRSAGDCTALYLALLAVGAHPSPVAVLAAFGAANVAGMVPLTPGGLGFVEAGITATLVATGVNTEHAVVAVALYRIASTWLPVIVGIGAYGVFRWRQRRAQRDVPGASAADAAGPGRRRRIAATVVTMVALTLVAPVLLRVYRRAPQVLTLGPGWLAAIAAAIIVHFVTAWALYRVVLRSTGWFDIATSQLAANAASHVAPAGSAVGAGMQLRMLTLAGYPASQATTALGATTVLGTVVGYIVLPLIVLIASLFGTTVQPRLAGAMWSGAALLVGLLILLLVSVARDAPWQWVARAVTAMRHRLHQPGDPDDLTRRLIHERDLIRATLRDRAALVAFLVAAQPLADYLALYLALRAVGAHVSPVAALAAFIVSNLAGLIPFTPGGLGFVEAGLVGVLVLAGSTRSAARLAVVVYRLAATWLPTLAGGVAFTLFQHRHRQPSGPGHGTSIPEPRTAPAEVPPSSRTTLM